MCGSGDAAGPLRLPIPVFRIPIQRSPTTAFGSVCVCVCRQLLLLLVPESWRTLQAVVDVG